MKIAYITTCFGPISHTFIRREIRELRALGLDIYLFGIHMEIAPELSKDEQDLVRGTTYVYPLRIFDTFSAHIWFILHKPGNYLSALTHSIFNEESSVYQHSILAYHFFLSAILAFQIHKTGSQHIHAHFLNVPATMALYCSKLLGIPFSVTNHSAGIATLPEMRGLKTKLKEAKYIFSISNYNKEYLSTEIYPCREKTHVVRCGMDINDYVYKVPHFIKKDGTAVNLLSIGRFVEKKGFVYLLEAVNILNEEGFRFHLTMIGDGPFRKELEELAILYKLSERVTFAGTLSMEDTKKMLPGSDILIVPSITARNGEKEGIPVVLMEAMAMGVFVISTRHSGIPELVEDKVTGLLVPEKDQDAIARAIKIAAEDEKLFERCVFNARKKIEADFNIKISAKYLKQYFEGSKKVAYITSSFGSLSHTFIRREIFALRRLGLEISLFGVRQDLATILSGEDSSLENETRYLYPLKIWKIICLNAHYFLRSPAGYLKTLLRAIFNEEKGMFDHIKLIYHFFVSAYLAHLIEKDGASHIHAHFFGVPATLAMYCSGLTGITFSVTDHSYLISGIRGRVAIKEIVNRAKYVFSISEHNISKVEASYDKHAKPGKTRLVRCGIDYGAYELNATANFNRVKGKPLLLAIGRLIEVKGFKYLIEAARVLRDQGMDFELSVIGEGPLEAELKKQIQDYDLTGRVHFEGALSRDQVKVALGKHDMLIVPSATAEDGEKEGIPVVIMEAMASGVLVIAADHSGISEIVRNNNTGLLVPEKDPAAIAKAVIRAEGDPGLRKNCVLNAIELVKSDLNIDLIAREIKNTFMA